MCEICHGINRRLCPNCGHLTARVCPDCGGTGNIHYAYDIAGDEGERVSREVYEALPDDEAAAARLGADRCKGEVETCPRCGGAGETEDDGEGFDEMASEEKWYTKKYGR